MKKIAMAVLLALSLAPAASFAQVVVRIGPPAPIVERRPPPQSAALCGLTDISAGMAAATFGFPAAGIVHPIPARIGLPTTGFTAAAVGSWSKATGARTSEGESVTACTPRLLRFPRRVG